MTEPTGSAPKLRLALLPLFSVIGASAAVYLAKHYYELRAGTAGFKSACNISATMNCDAVSASRFAEIIPGLPLASFVAGWFIALLFFGLMARAPSLRREAVLMGAIMSGFASLYSLALLIVMAVILKNFCLFCLVIDAANFILFGTYLSLLRAGSETSLFGGLRLPRLQTNALLALGTLFVVVVILRPSAENAANQPTSSEVQYTVNRILERTPVEVKVPEGAAVLGNPSAPITIHEFSDFQCPFCRRGAVLMNQILARYSGKVRVIFIPFPLDNSCNRLITRPMHPYACELARSAYCSGKDGKFQPVYEKIFDEQEFLNAESATRIPAEYGVGAEALKSCVTSEEAKRFLSASIEEGIRLKVEATPTFFINGKMVDASLPIEAWDQLIAGAK